MSAVRNVQTAEGTRCTRAPCRVALLGGFALTSEDACFDLTADAERLVAFLALNPGRRSRSYVAGTLWGDGTQDRAFGNLRSALWRVRRQTSALIDADTQALGLTPTTDVDVDAVLNCADRLHAPGTDRTEVESNPAPNPAAFGQELLPGWSEEWVVVHRERLRQLSLHALEALADLLTDRGLHAAAIQTALSAIALDPLRESPHRCLIRTHLDEGNFSEAIAHYRDYECHLRTELGIAPSRHLEELIAQVLV
jgi:DNA-binding SARP family transcriptional activator